MALNLLGFAVPVWHHIPDGKFIFKGAAMRNKFESDIEDDFVFRASIKKRIGRLERKIGSSNMDPKNVRGGRRWLRHRREQSSWKSSQRRPRRQYARHKMPRHYPHFNMLDFALMSAFCGPG
jgi:hypothetical protein